MPLTLDTASLYPDMNALQLTGWRASVVTAFSPTGVTIIVSLATMHKTDIVIIICFLLLTYNLLIYPGYIKFVGHKVKDSHRRHICNSWLLHSISYHLQRTQRAWLHRTFLHCCHVTSRPTGAASPGPSGACARFVSQVHATAT